MPFPRRLLANGEDVVVELRPHWSYLGRALPVAIGALALVIAVSVAWPSAPTWIDDMLLIVFGICALWLAVRVVRWRRTTLVVTTQRIVQRSGVLARRGIDVRLDRVNEISYHQSIGGRLVGEGRVVVELGGERGIVAIDHVNRPAALAGLLHEQIAALQAPRRAPQWAGRAEPQPQPQPQPQRQPPSDDTPPAGSRLSGLRHGQGAEDGPSTSVARQIYELDELRRRGIITEEEFSRKKAELLDRM